MRVRGDCWVTSVAFDCVRSVVAYFADCYALHLGVEGLRNDYQGGL